VVEAPGKKLWQIEIISQKEKKRLLFDFNRTTAGYPKSKTIRQLFVEQAARTPDNTALIGKNPKQEGPFGQINARGEENLITYRELNDRTGQWAYLLQEKGVKPDNIVGIMAEPAVETIIALLGILKAGAAYLPIHPDYPQERIDFMMKDSKAKVLLTAPDISNLSFSSTLTLTSTCQVSSTNLAYVIYTSGTTGKPKGTLLKHENLVNYVHWFSGKTRLTGKDKSVLTASFAFDLGYTTIYPTLLRGAQLHILPKETYMLPESLLDYIRSRGISYLKMTPSLFSPLLASSLFSRETCQSLRLVVLGGEAIHAADVEKAYAICPHLEIMNHYGPTEVTIGCIAQFIARENLETYKIRPTIGRPIFNTQAYILDKYLEVLPPGAAGELCLSGDGPARGYLNNPELTAEKFPILNKAWYYRSYRSYKSYILYRTGDLARWLADGNIEFLGRIDQQIKIRGFRIELDEIEHQLIRHDDIKEAAVVAKTGDTGDQYLCAYIVSHRKSQLTGTGLTEFLSMKLPDYMIPPYFVFLDAIPLTPNGKIDRKALPEPGTTTKDKAYIAPRNQIEEQLVEIWSETLALSKEQISIDANFFQLGGHSLRATIMISRVHKQLRVRVPLAEIFKTPNIRGLAKYISGLKKEVYTSIEPVEKKEYYVLSSAQERLYILQQMDPQSTAYNMPQMIPLDMVGQMDRKRLERAIYHLIDRHENFRTYFEEIHEVPAQRLQRQVKVEVEFYDSIDPAARGSKLAASTINNFVRPFDLSHAPLLRVGLIEIHQPTRILMVDMHHIISDLLSRFILERDFISLVTGRELLPLPIQYKDYAQWRHHRETIKSTRHQKEYWLKEYEGEIPLLNLPMDYKRGEKLGFAGSSIPFTIDGALAAKINQCVRQLEVTMMMFLFSIYNILLGKYADQEELVMGTAAAGRQHADLENIIGFFVNMLAIKTCPHPDKTFVQYLKEVKEKAVNAYENQGYPFEELVSQLDIPRHPGRHPLVDAVFAFYNQPGTPAETRGKQAKEAPDFNPFNITHFDLMLQAVNAGDSIQMDFQYSTDLFKKSSIKELKCFYMDILDQVVENPAIELKEIRVNLNLMTSSSTIFEEDQDEWKL
jgi:amino acid adenylation domain-containing protein